MHSPSEHTVHGKHYDMEMHSVHAINKNTDTAWVYGVVGIFFSVNDHTADLNELETEKYKVNRERPLEVHFLRKTVYGLHCLRYDL